MKQAIETRQQAYKRITDGIRSFVNHSVGAMKLVQEAKRLEIWKEKWGNWQEYCENEFGKSARRAYQLLEIAGTIDEIQSVKPFHTESEENKEILKNLNSRQATALKGLPPVQKAEVWAKAVNGSGGKSPKPEAIAAVRRDYSDVYLSGNEKPKDAVKIVDEEGGKIPDELYDLWESRSLCDEIAKKLSELKCFFERMEEERNPLFRQMNCQDAHIKLQAIRYCVVQSKPYALCTQCHGHPTANPKGCPVCISTGFVGKDRWGKAPEEFRRMQSLTA